MKISTNGISISFVWSKYVMMYIVKYEACQDLDFFIRQNKLINLIIRWTSSINSLVKPYMCPSLCYLLPLLLAYMRSVLSLNLVTYSKHSHFYQTLISHCIYLIPRISFLFLLLCLCWSWHVKPHLAYFPNRSPQLGDFLSVSYILTLFTNFPKITTSKHFYRPSIDDLVLLTLMEHLLRLKTEDLRTFFCLLNYVIIVFGCEW